MIKIITKIWVLPIVAAGSLDAATLLWQDNFDTANTTVFDAAPLAGRLSGTLASTVFASSAKIQHGISNNQLNFLDASGDSTFGRLRFQDSGGVYDWASGTTGSTILNAGGVRISFDWTPTVSDANWIAFNIGHDSSDPNQRLISADTDSAILFRNDGSAGQVFDSGAGSNVAGFTNTDLGTPRHVVIDYLFDSFADGTALTLNATVDGTLVYSGSAGQWAGNGGALHMELETNSGELIDNLSISAVPEPATLALLGLGGFALILRRRK